MSPPAFLLPSLPHAVLSHRSGLAVNKSCRPFFTSRFAGTQLQPRPVSHSYSPLLSPLRVLPRCYADSSRGDNNDDDDDDDFDEDPDILLKEEGTDRVLPVGIQHTIPHKGINYVVCYPIDDPVAFAYLNDSDELEAIEDGDMLERLFPNAEAVLAEEHIVLKKTPFILTVDDHTEGLDEDDEDDEDDDFDLQDGDDEDRAVEVLAEFNLDNIQYFVVRPMDEVLLVAKEVNEGESYYVLNQPELDSITPIIEEFIANLDPQLSMQ